MHVLGRIDGGLTSTVSLYAFVYAFAPELSSWIRANAFFSLTYCFRIFRNYKFRKIFPPGQDFLKNIFLWSLG